MSIFDPPRPGDDHWDEERNWRFEEERRRERERQHAPAWPDPADEPMRRQPPDALRLEPDPPAIGPDPIMLMVVQVPHGTEGELVRAVAPLAAKNSVTLILWDRRPRRRHRRGMKLLFGRKLGKRLTG